MTSEEFEILTGEEAGRLIDENIGSDPAKLALSLKCGRDVAQAVCTQVKYLQRCKAKLPSYYSARCIIPPLSYEQSSSEAAAAEKEYSGEICIDLTCGLGVDTYNFSRRFGKVVSVEIDPVLAEVAKYNFGALGAMNITVENTSAEEFLEKYDGEKADLIFVDPARRGEKGEKLVLAQDCSPDVLSLMPLLLKHGRKVLIKLSPLFDVEEAARVFAPHVAKIETVSVKNECREVLVELSEDAGTPVTEVTATGKGRYRFAVGDIGNPKGGVCDQETILSSKYLLIPDTGFYKSRLVGALFNKYYPETEVHIPSENGFCFAGSVPENFCGRAFSIEQIAEYNPRLLKKTLKDKGVKRINIYKRDFRYSSEDIKKSLGVSEGGNDRLAFTGINGKPFAIILAKSSSGIL